jgi:hypothetical protein
VYRKCEDVYCEVEYTFFTLANVYSINRIYFYTTKHKCLMYKNINNNRTNYSFVIYCEKVPHFFCFEVSQKLLLLQTENGKMCGDLSPVYMLQSDSQ